MEWNNFNTAPAQEHFELIPAGTIAAVRLTMRPGGYDDAAQCWNGGYATRNQETGSVYLSCEFVILEGAYARRKVWGLIGLHSNKGPEWQNMGRAFIRGILNSANGLSEKEDSPLAQQKRRIQHLNALEGITFVVKIGVHKDAQGQARNEIRYAVTVDKPEYKEHAAFLTSPQPMSLPVGVPANNRPHWAQ